MHELGVFYSRINVKNTKSMVVDKTNNDLRTDIKIENHHIEQVKEFCILKYETYVYWTLRKEQRLLN